MPTLPWTPTTTDPPAEPIVLGSRLQLRSFRDVARFLRAAMGIRTQVLETPGAIGVSLIAQPLRKTFWTLSAWSDQDTLDSFVRTRPHLDVMRTFHGRLIDPQFETWTIPSGDLPKARSRAKALWDQARARLAASTNGATV